MGKHQKKYFSTKIQSSLGTREFIFTMTPDRIESKEKGKAAHTKCTTLWSAMVGFAFIFSPRHDTIPADLRSLDISLRAADKTLRNQDFRIWFGDKGLYFGRIGVSAKGVTHLTWRNVLNYGLLCH